MINISIIELPFNLGLKEPFPGQEPGVRKMPAWLRKHNFHNLIAPEDVQTLYSPVYRMEIDPESAVLNADAIVQYAKEQARLLSRVLSERKFPIVIGGDCSIVLGNTLALKQKGNYALFYLDGHTDFIEPQLSQTGAVGGMAAAIAAGRGPRKLTNINDQAPYIKEEYVWCVGNREYEEEYENAVRNSKAKYVSLAMLREKGISHCVGSFLGMVHKQRLDGFWLHLDVDFLADDIMPAVDSRTPDGLTYEEFNEILDSLLASSKITGLDITILDPDLDPSGKYTKDFVDNFACTFNNAMKSYR